MELKTDRLILRPWRESDAESLYEYARNPAVGPAAGWPPHTNVADSRRVIREVLSADETYAVCLKSDGIAIGSIGLMTGNAANRFLPATEAELGYWIGVPFWGRALIPEAAHELIRHGFCDLRLQKIWCGHFDGNNRSRRVIEKCGFTYHHTDSNFVCKLTGDIRTEHLFSLSREDWLRHAAQLPRTSQ